MDDQPDQEAATDTPAAPLDEPANAVASDPMTPEQTEKTGPRRSTVREKVTFLSDAQPSAAPVVPEPVPPAASESTAPDADPAAESGAPRRAGWWSRRFGGGE